jgi:flagellar hook protein FlgE
MIIAQQAYSAASQVISTTSGMFDTLIQAMR